MIVTDELCYGFQSNFHKMHKILNLFGQSSYSSSLFLINQLPSVI
uniref:Uncharacterized protein n=1 Tax=Rhizophora mucronata TaxID=61149 RepID=A0A2P2PBL8_RHIMU